MSEKPSELKLLANTIRMLSADAVQKANSGHPGMPMGAADYAAVLWSKYLRFNPQDPAWPNRDRFILSAGHGCMLLYSLLHLFGYDLPLSELQSFRQWQSKTPGHPEFGHTVGVETTTGPLGQGFANGVGMAISGKMLAERYSKQIFDYRVFGIVSDGDLMEGVASEAASIAGNLGLDNLVYLYDDNHISIGGDTKVCFTESVPKRFEAYGWFVQSVDGHDQEAIAQCIEKAIAEPSRPSIICCRTTIGWGSPNKANTHGVHGAPLGEDELKLTKQKLNWPLEPRFYIPDEVKRHCAQAIESKVAVYQNWSKGYSQWSEQRSDLAGQYELQVEKNFSSSLRADLLAALSGIKDDATRNISGKAIQVIAKHCPGFVGGSADLEPSTKTLISGTSDIQHNAFSGRNLRFGVREHAMGSIVNGLAYSREWIPYSATFLVFADYMRPPIRLAALSHLQSLFIFTHDSFWVGEDGPTHEPIEHIASLRIIPGLYVFRPADGVEVAMCYEAALRLTKSPSSLLFTRQNIPLLERHAGFNPEEVLKGAYIVSGADCQDLVIIATGSEVWVAQQAAKELAKIGKTARVVSMPCVEKYLELSSAEKEAIIPKVAKKVSLEAGITTGWQTITGTDGLNIGIDHYGASAPGEVLAEKFGINPIAVKNQIEQWLKSAR